ncbi:1-phosphofructokinase family hexose kinase [Paenirhodobacter sp.]|uniref:1-phosphofructokinase family hexose kinase n=1 Tax=Paenirhodobacter sp. TaxID=1965326 RepID=UPI003B3FD82D
MIHTICLNPAIDQTVGLAELVPGEVLRADFVRLDPGGKAVNVASVLADWGLPVTVHGLLGADNADGFEALFTRKGIADAMIRMPGATRTNIKILETGGRTTDVNLPGFAADAAAADAVRAGLNAVTGLAVVSGSQPAGLPADTTARIVADLAGQGARVVLDVSGAPLTEALSAPVLPYAVKPNRHELEAFAGRSLADRAELVAVARDLLARGIGLVVVSLGTEGAVFLSAEGGVQVRPLALATGSTVGAGDAMVAGITAGLSEGLPLADLARRATAFAAGKLRNAGPHLPPKAEVEALAQQVALCPVEAWMAGH